MDPPQQPPSFDFYCMGCKKKDKGVNHTSGSTKRGSSFLKGDCSSCKRKVCRFVPKEKK